MPEPVFRKALAAHHDMELARLAAAGDRAAFGELVRRHCASVRALLRRMGAEPALADDVAQDAFIAAFERIAEFRGEGAFPAWVRRIAARLYVRRSRRGLVVSLMTTEPAAGDTDGAAGGEGETVARMDLDSALTALSPAERVSVSLCYGAGLTHAEAAEVLGAPVGTVKSHLKRGLEKLRRRMGVASASVGGAREQADHV